MLNLFQHLPNDGKPMSVIMQMYLVYTATKLGQFDYFEGIENDIKKFLNFPLQAAVWDEIKEFHDREFVEYIEELQDD